MQKNEDGPAVTMEQSFNLVLFAAQSFACCFYPFLRSGQGRMGMGMPGLMAAVLIPLWAGWLKSLPLLHLWWPWLCMGVYRRLEGAFLRWRGRRIHSHYSGWPWITGLVFRDERNALRAEVAMLLGASFLIADFGLAMFFRAGAISLAVIALIRREMEVQRREALTDAEIEFQNYGR